ncbi:MULTISPECIES: ester cyclase [unclassified Pseudomonas]|uniref:ester cyclase n=1 Tax=unclassified Pseudomonas TaxID=196821 RepID=UPI000BDC0420|nr:MULTISPECIES: ester cyclase [unclassified Pseudomonas]PVZ20552.1 putative ester cyclase [Pseudomonas sp. URIL14HWK12:I12]PVZ27618.1 putative ester cyclase [Pseudomonas sp. URIL14HWK12:I10]PVZ38507.1 putative ester cyclase [Pseudomonas sp. URIL14HWK12:I11]SNZ03083.1 Predicted ester cyclase [Pseudomonas sp. URIL14HWK12:I9]
MSTPALASRLHTERLAIETLYRAFSDNDPDLVDSVLAPHWDDIPLAPGQGPGPEGIKPIIRSLAEAFPDVRVVIHDMMQAPGRVAVRAEITGTHLGELFGIAATGKKVSLRLHEFHALEEGRVVTTWHMEDWFGLFLQLGQFPKA